MKSVKVPFCKSNLIKIKLQVSGVNIFTMRVFNILFKIHKVYASAVDL